ncbi:hypothetical protein RV09_GL003279 [Enterococcus moraviensis]|nr:hypothetical protein RV09_GL003279 [Enterococcus moraviensis]
MSIKKEGIVGEKSNPRFFYVNIIQSPIKQALDEINVQQSLS